MSGGNRCRTAKLGPGMSERYLLDTHVLLWAVTEPHRLAASVRFWIENQQYVVSVASLWELINKKGKRDAPVRDRGPGGSIMWSSRRLLSYRSATPTSSIWTVCRCFTKTPTIVS